MLSGFRFKRLGFTGGDKMKKCVICKTKFTPINSSLEKWCCPDHGYLYSKQQKEKADRKEWSKKKVELREATKKKSEYEKDLEKLVNKLCRLVDIGQKCISCGSNDAIHAGHFASVGSMPYLRYNLFNLFPQCYQCNVKKGGNVAWYRINLTQTFGTEFISMLDGLFQTKALHLSIGDLKEKIIEARLLVKEFEAANMALTHPRNSEQRIEMRKYINKRLNIY